MDACPYRLPTINNYPFRNEVLRYRFWGSSNDYTIAANTLSWCDAFVEVWTNDINHSIKWENVRKLSD